MMNFRDNIKQTKTAEQDQQHLNKRVHSYEIICFPDPEGIISFRRPFHLKHLNGGQTEYESQEDCISSFADFVGLFLAN